ncbi:hypothetical protein Vi05172_g13217 [Venturia inaequalis]|nr:hypothetical protein Vi05172_g13217 [Venturia inaequalis]
MLKSLFFLFVFLSITLACDQAKQKCCWNYRCLDIRCNDRLVCSCRKYHDGCKNQHHGQSHGCFKGTLQAQKCTDDLSNNCVSNFLTEDWILRWLHYC